MQRKFWMNEKSRYIPQGAVKVSDKSSDAVAYLWTNSKGKPCAQVFYGKQSKPIWQFYFQSEENRQRRIREAFEGRRESLAIKAKRAEDRKNLVNDYKVGDILNTCWGYDQTNREFFEVAAVSGKTLTLRELRQTTIHDGGLAFSGKCAPLPGDYIGEPIKRRIGQFGVKIDYCRIASRSTMIEIVPGVQAVKPLHYSWDR